MPIGGGILVIKLARSYGLFERGAGSFLTLMPTRCFNILLYKRDRIVWDNEGNNFSISDVNDEVQPDLGRRVRPRPDDTHEEPPVILVEDEMPMDLYNRVMCRYQDNIGWAINYQNMHTDLLCQHLQIS